MATDRGKLLGTYVDEAFAEAVRVRAFEERCSKGEILRRALRAYLGLATETTGTRGRKTAGRYPTQRQAMRTTPQPAQPETKKSKDH